MEKPFLDFYSKYMGKEMPEQGLCDYFENYDDDGMTKEDSILSLFRPDENYITEFSYWGRLPNDPGNGYCNEFRQNVLLFCAAMNNEL